jgi:hypothetical protein
VRRQAGCLLSAAAVLAATVLPWSSTGAASRNGWQTASLALALDEALDLPVLTVLACVWFVVPVAAACALCSSVLLPRHPAAVALRTLGALLVLAALAVLIAVHRAGLDIAPVGPLLATAAGAALVALPAPFRSRWSTRPDAAPVTGVRR